MPRGTETNVPGIATLDINTEDPADLMLEGEYHAAHPSIRRNPEMKWGSARAETELFKAFELMDIDGDGQVTKEVRFVFGVCVSFFWLNRAGGGDVREVSAERERGEGGVCVAVWACTSSVPPSSGGNQMHPVADDASLSLPPPPLFTPHPCPV
jgi:hypothetical protein